MTIRHFLASKVNEFKISIKYRYYLRTLKQSEAILSHRDHATSSILQSFQRPASLELVASDATAHPWER